jgi:hypothetical protein
MRAPVPLAALLVLVASLALAPAATARPSEHPFEIAPGSFKITPSATQAAAHADLVTEFDFAREGSKTDNDVRTTIVNLPPGFVGNNTAIPVCTVAQLVGNPSVGSQASSATCPVASQVGMISLECTGCVAPQTGGPVETVTVPVYNVEVTSFGTTAVLGFNIGGNIIQTLPVTVRPGDSGITVTSPNIEKITEPHHVVFTVWGLPAAHVHDSQRGLACGSFQTPECETRANGQHEFVHPVPAGIPVKPFLANATSCEPHVASMTSNSWESPEFVPLVEAPIAALSECERVPFEPSIEVAPTTRSAESSSGLNVSLVVPQSWDNPESIASAHLKDSVVTLPVGYTANPSLASGLTNPCSSGQFESETSSSAPGAGCPAESKIGTVDVETPVLAEHLTGNIYIATPYENRFGSLLALYIVVKDPARGIVVKLAGKIDANPVTGQLVTTFDGNPQVPFSRFTLKLRQGANSPLVSPPACGSYTAEADLTPWSAPTSPQHVLSPPFAIESGIGGGPCPAGGVPPFHPGIVAGTLNNSAGAYSPLSIRITRQDGEQEITRFSSQFPPGLSARLTGVPFCPDAAIEEAKRTSGARQETNPSCPAASEIGHSLVGAGVGSTLAWTPGKVYMAGPYNGAPFSIVAITSAKVGPFDLGTVVVREALHIDPITAAVAVDAKASDPIPHIIKGIVIHVRDIRVSVDRPSFMINPTSCERMSLAATVNGAGADFTNLADQQPVTITSPFQLANCQNLQFNPGFQVSTSGKTSKANGASLNVKLTYPNAPQGTQANIARVKVDLPKQLPSRLTTLQKGCTAAQFNTNPAGCPAASVVGHARAITPILPVPLEGPAYFVSHGGEAFPSLIVVLQGYGVTIDLVGSTFISKAGITSSTFKTVPDQPVTSFELTLPQGPFSALTANGDLCALTRTVLVKRKVKVRIRGHKRTITRRVRQTLPASLSMPTEFVAQNGAALHQSTPVSVTGCAKTVRHERKKKKAKRRK